MKNQSGTIKTNLELYRVVKGGSGGYRRLPGGSAHFSLQTNRHTLHHNIYYIYHHYFQSDQKPVQARTRASGRRGTGGGTG